MQPSSEELGQRITDELTDVFLHFVAADHAFRTLRLQMEDEGGFDLEKPFLSWVPIATQ